MSRITTFSDIGQANRFVGRTLSNTYAPINSVLTVYGNAGIATFVDITSTLSSAGYTPGDLTGFSTGISTVIADQYTLILALYQVTSTSFSTLAAELSSPVFYISNINSFSTSINSTFDSYYALINALYQVTSTSFSTLNAEISSASTLVTTAQLAGLSNACLSTIGKMPVAKGVINVGQTLSNNPIQFTSSIVLGGWNWFPLGAPGGNISSFYASTPGVYEVTSRINYTTAETNSGLLMQLRNAGGSVLDEVVTNIQPSGSILTSNSITFQTIQSLSNDYLYMYMSTLSTTTSATIQTLSGNISMKLLYNSNLAF
jgi:hypothetical protein